MEKLLPVERIFEKLEKNGENEGFVVKINLHYAEKSLNCQEYLKSGKKNWFPLAKQPVSTSQNEILVSKIYFQSVENR